MVRNFRLYWFGLLLFPALSGIAARSASGEETNRPALSPAVKRVLAWFPEDTEAIGLL